MSHLPSSDASGDSASGGPVRDRRALPRATVELQALWRPHGSPEPPTLALLFDLSPRGARLAGWIPLDLRVGDEIDLLAEGAMVWRARVVRSLGGGEYGVHFHDLSAEVKRRIITTVGLARAGHEGWADV